MGQLETNLKNKYEATLTRYQRLWRANSGEGWAGELVKIKGRALKLVGLRKLKLWPKGTPDCIGFDSIIIEKHMVGKRVAVFVGTEFKATKEQKLGKKQRDWRALIVRMGGIHREVRNDRVIETSELI